jgi:hypothetical protein
VFTSKKLRKHHRSLDHRNSENITEVQFIEAQKVSQKLRSQNLRKYYRCSDQRNTESIIEIQMKKAQKVSQKLRS